MEAAFIVIGLPLLGGALTAIVGKLMGPSWAHRFSTLLLILLLASVALAKLNPTFDWGMYGALASIALIPIQIGSAVTAAMLKRRAKADTKGPGLSPSID